MPRANRHYVLGYVWHITHRCHKKEFLLKFARDRRRLLWWLFEARKRYGLCVLNNAITSNHIHLLVRDKSHSNVISKSIQLIAGKTGEIVIDTGSSISRQNLRHRHHLDFELTQFLR